MGPLVFVQLSGCHVHGTRQRARKGAGPVVACGCLELEGTQPPCRCLQPLKFWTLELSLVKLSDLSPQQPLPTHHHTSLTFLWLPPFPPSGSSSSTLLPSGLPGDPRSPSLALPLPCSCGSLLSSYSLSFWS